VARNGSNLCSVAAWHGNEKAVALAKSVMKMAAKAALAASAVASTMAAWRRLVMAAA